MQEGKWVLNTLYYNRLKPWRVMCRFACDYVAQLLIFPQIVKSRGIFHEFHERFYLNTHYVLRSAGTSVICLHLTRP